MDTDFAFVINFSDIRADRDAAIVQQLHEAAPVVEQ